MKVDVTIQVYGKPWQTLCTLKSLMKWSGKHIDKIYLVTEPVYPYGDNTEWIKKHFDNLICFNPKRSALMNKCKDDTDESERHTIYCQYSFEKSDKKFVFVTHNDILYTGDVIGDMLNNIEDNVAIGEIGQCWNCPFKEMCGGGEKWNNWNPKYEDLLTVKLPHVRTRIENLNKEIPKLVPECRVNEWACLINLEMSNKETYPNGNTPYFGNFGTDSGTPWFKSLYTKGYKFKDYRKNYKHAYWSDLSNGYQTVLRKDYYWRAEKKAEEYFKENF